MATGTLIIPVSATASVQGCIGTYNAMEYDRGGLGAIANDEVACKYFFGDNSWAKYNYDTPEGQYMCLLKNVTWFEDKTYTVEGTATQTTSYGETASTSFNPTFDGFKIELDNGWWRKHYDGRIIVKKNMQVVSNEPPVSSTNEETTTPETSGALEILTKECSANIECKTICGSKTPTCQNNKCYCDEIVYKSSANVFGKIANFIQGIIDKLFSWLK
jgi:hypothetical protein